MRGKPLHIGNLMRQLLVAVMVLLPAVVPAQELQITDARCPGEPMLVSMQRRDHNNEICALVKVELPVSGVLFEGNIVGEPLFKASEYWVYMTPGTKMLKIKVPGYYPVMAYFSELGLGRLEAKTIYYLTLKGTAAASDKPDIETNYAVINVEPPTATVKIDGQTQTIDDGSVVVLLKLGQHTWQAEAAGYAAESGTFQVTAADKATVNVHLQSQKARIQLNTVADADVFVNGQQHGRGSRKLELLPGIYKLELRRQGYKPHTQTIELQPSQSVTVDCTEFAPVYGILNVNYRPVGATITLDGRQIGTTPAKLNDINIGTYSLAISAPGYATHTQQVTITETTPVTLTGTLQKQASATTSPTAIPAPSQVNTRSLTPPDLSQLKVAPKNLDLCAELNGRAVCINKEQWNKLSATEREAYKNKWLYVTGKDKSGNQHSFLLALNDSGEGMTWNEAMSRYGNSLPTKEQCGAMAKHSEAINKAIIAFGGDYPKFSYWTRTESDSSLAWYVYMLDGYVNYTTKTSTYRVRAVAPVPVASAM